MNIRTRLGIFGIFRYRTLLCGAVLFLIGIFMSYGSAVGESGLNGISIIGKSTAFVLLAASVFVLILAAVLVVGPFLKRLSTRRAVLIISALAVLAAGISYPIVYSAVFYAPCMSLGGTHGTVNGIIVSEPKMSESGKSMTAYVKVRGIESADGRTVESGRVTASFTPTDGLKYGDGVTFDARLELPNEKIEDFEYRKYLLSQGCCLAAFGDEVKTYDAKLGLWERFCAFGYTVRDKIREYISEVIIDERCAALLTGIMIGSKRGFSDELYTTMSESGFIHIAAVSGLHIGFLCTIMGVLFMFLRRRIRPVFEIPILVIFMTVSAFVPSASRAAIMMIIFLISEMLMESSDPLTSLAFAALCMLIQNPYVIYSMSFVLSFLSTFSLIVFMGPLEMLSGRLILRLRMRFIPSDNKKLNKKRNKIRSFAPRVLIGCLRWCLASIAISVSCQIGLTAVLSLYFDRVTLMSLFGNILVIPCTLFVFSAAVLGFVIYLISPPAAMFFALIIIEPLLKIICITAGLFSNFSYAPEHKVSFAGILIYYAVCVAAYTGLVRLCGFLDERNGRSVNKEPDMT